ncbi:cyclase family protein, partial [Bacillus velezensis]|uniref:cyclase family protein n=1 Tax=Bacillus velezensis TaxID=492670 RepID=UPI003CE8C898
LAQTCVQGRGVLIDLREAGTPPHGRISYDSLMRAADAQGADVAEGDFLCIYTGYADLLLRDGAGVDRAALAACPGLDGSDT